MAEEILIDEYTLVNHIATGSATQVWEAVEKGGGDRHWAMKLMLPEALADSGHRSVLKHEAKVSERLDHPNLVRFNKLVMNKKRGYIVMDYFRAPNLKSQLQTDIVSLQVRIGRLFEQLCQALGYLHAQGWVHRDVKPDNILFNKSSELRLIDFSLTTRAAGAMSQLISGKGKVIQGTRTYISPETILKAPPSPQADIYSLGITLFEVLAGEPPFRGTSPDDLLKKHLTSAAPPPSFFNDNVTPEMDRFVLKMLAKKTKDRHKSTIEMLAEFRNIKPFKEDAAERDRRKRKEQDERNLSTLDKSGRLDSRADHLKQRFLKDNPDLAKAEAEKKKAIAKPVRLPSEEKAAPAKPAAAPARAAPPAPPKSAPAPPQPQPQPMHQYPAGYGYPGQMPAPYPQAGYPPGAGYPQPPGGYPQPAGYPPAAGYAGQGYPPQGYPQGYPPSGYPASGYPGAGAAPPGYPQSGFPHTQPPMPSQQVPPQQMPPQGGPAPGGPPPGYPSGAPAQPPGSASYGSQMRMPSGAPQPSGSAQPGQAPPRPAPGRPVPAGPPNANQAPPAIDEQQQLLQQLLGQPAGPQAAPPSGAAGRPPQAQRPATPSAGPGLPLMDQLPPVK